MKFLRVTLKILSGLLFFLVLLALATITTLDYTPYRQMEYYREWKRNIASVSIPKDSGAESIRAGWAKVNITPETPVPMAGYGNRWGRAYETVHDSIYVRAIVLDNGRTRAALVVADLLIIPPTVTQALRSRLSGTGYSFDQVYLSATHSHSSIGGWGDTITGKLFAGTYDPGRVGQIADAIILAIGQAHRQRQPIEIGYTEVKDTVDVINRLRGLSDTTVDPWIRLVQFRAVNGPTALLTTYAAHATVLDSRTYALSRDYAGALVDSLEDGEADFAMYMAGAVGSMGPMGMGNSEFERVGNLADGVESAIQTRLGGVNTHSTDLLRTFTVGLPLRDPSPRLNQTFALRSWVFRWIFGDYPSFVKVLRVGDIVMVALPCDFSGELVKKLSRYATSKGLKLIITSFNGAYAGYITDDRHFDKDQYETITMSWFGPYNGAYFQEVVKDVIDKVAQ
jgi:neutral ceramidase